MNAAQLGLCVRLQMLPGDAAVVCLTCVDAHVSDTLTPRLPSGRAGWKMEGLTLSLLTGLL